MEQHGRLFHLERKFIELINTAEKEKNETEAEIERIQKFQSDMSNFNIFMNLLRGFADSRIEHIKNELVLKQNVIDRLYECKNQQIELFLEESLKTLNLYAEINHSIPNYFKSAIKQERVQAHEDNLLTIKNAYSPEFMKIFESRTNVQQKLDSAIDSKNELLESDLVLMSEIETADKKILDIESEMAYVNRNIKNMEISLKVEMMDCAQSSISKDDVTSRMVDILRRGFTDICNEQAVYSHLLKKSIQELQVLVRNESTYYERARYLKRLTGTSRKQRSEQNTGRSSTSNMPNLPVALLTENKEEIKSLVNRIVKERGLYAEKYYPTEIRWQFSDCNIDVIKKLLKKLKKTSTNSLEESAEDYQLEVMFRGLLKKLQELARKQVSGIRDDESLPSTSGSSSNSTSVDINHDEEME